MGTVHHYMVDHLDAAGSVVFANDREIASLTAAKSLASKVSKQIDTGAYVVAYRALDKDAKTFEAVGHISFFGGKQSDTDGVVL